MSACLVKRGSSFISTLQFRCCWFRLPNIIGAKKKSSGKKKTLGCTFNIKSSWCLVLVETQLTTEENYNIKAISWTLEKKIWSICDYVTYFSLTCPISYISLTPVRWVASANHNLVLHCILVFWVYWESDVSVYYSWTILCWMESYQCIASLECTTACLNRVKPSTAPSHIAVSIRNHLKTGVFYHPTPAHAQGYHIRSGPALEVSGNGWLYSIDGFNCLFFFRLLFSLLLFAFCFRISAFNSHQVFVAFIVQSVLTWK